MLCKVVRKSAGVDLGGECRGCPPPPEMTCGFLIQLVFCKKKKYMWFIGVEVEQETSEPQKNTSFQAPIRSQNGGDRLELVW